MVKTKYVSTPVTNAVARNERRRLSGVVGPGRSSESLHCTVALKNLLMNIIKHSTLLVRGPNPVRMCPVGVSGTEGGVIVVVSLAG